MSFGNKAKGFLLLVGDIAALYLALFLTLLVRYGAGFYAQFVNRHLAPFSIVFIPWLIIFYIAGLYDLRRLRNNLDFLKNLGLVLLVNAFLTIALFYLIPSFGITPKTNLFLFIVLFAITEWFWRRSFNKLIAAGEAPNKVLLVGNGRTAKEIYEFLGHNPQVGYEVKVWLKEESTDAALAVLWESIKTHQINLVVIPHQLKKDTKLAKALYSLLRSGVEIRDLPNFYEIVFRKIPLAELEESWFLENLIGHQKFYDPLKRGGEFLLALTLGIVLLPLELFIAFLTLLTSPGPVIYKQTRVAQHGREFMLYKFRTMSQDAEKHGGAQWSGPNDHRVTPLGQLLRYTHLDELPQFLNLIKGDISFVGPRPERPEFVNVLKEKIPHYEIRLLIKPGVTGWAQIHHHKDTTVEDVKEKLEYDIYYLKNRSLVLDLAIIVKTLKAFFVNPQ